MWMWRQRPERQAKGQGPTGPPLRALGTGHQASEDLCSLNGISLLSLDSLSDPSIPFSFPLWKWECLSCTWKEIAVFSLHGSGDRKAFRAGPLLRVTLRPDVDDVEDELWDLQVTLEWVKTLGNVGMG